MRPFAAHNRPVVERGFVVLGDVSGYGEFVATTELEHSREILGELLDTVCECAPGSLAIAQLEGDAVFWLCQDDAVGLVELLKEKFVEFHRRLRFMTLATTCPCRACVAVGSLTLKFVVHRGSWVRQRVAGHDHFVGDDLVLAHRLLKNSVPSHEYILLTETALAAVAVDRAVAHQEHVEHHGPVRCAYLELSALRSHALKERTDHLERPEAQSSVERSFPVPVAEIRRAMRDASMRGRGEHLELLEDPQGLEQKAGGSARTPFVPRPGMKHVIARRGARGTPLGQETHCHHHAGSLLRVIRCEHDVTGSRTTLHVIPATVGSSDFYVTQIVSATPTGCLVELRHAWEPIGDPATRVPEWLADYNQEQFDRLAAVVARKGRRLDKASAMETGSRPRPHE